MVLLAVTVAAKRTLSPFVTVTQIALGFVHSCFFSHHFPPTNLKLRMKGGMHQQLLGLSGNS